MTNQRGIALLEVIVVGFAVLLMVLPAISTVAKLADASAVVNSAARDAAVWVARHGGEPPMVDDVELSVAMHGGEVEVTASRDVVLVGVGGSDVVRTVHSRVQVTVSDYRSSP